MKRISMILVFLSACVWPAYSQIAELVPAAPFADREVKREALALDRMEIDVRFLDTIARVRIVQVYFNRNPEIFEGQYRIFIRSQGMLDDFAIWENGERLRGVILEKKQARSLYEEIKYREIDPGLAARPEGEEEHQAGVVTIKVAPIPAYGYKRVEFSYVEQLQPVDFAQTFTLHIAPESGRVQKVRELAVRLSGRFALDVEAVEEGAFFASGLAVRKGELHAEKKLADVSLTQNINVRFRLKRREVHAFQFYRNPEVMVDYYSVSKDFQSLRDEDGYFASVSLLPEDTGRLPGGRFHFILDLSTSITPENLRLEIEGLSRLLGRLGKDARYRVSGFNRDLFAIDETFQPPEAAAIQATFDKIHRLRLASGSNLARALALASSASGEPERPVIFTDGFPTVGEIRFGEMLRLPLKGNLFLVGLGTIQNEALLAKLAEVSSGFYQPLFESASADAKLDTLARLLQSDFFTAVKPQFAAADVKQLYPETLSGVFSGSGILLTGKYRVPGRKKFAWNYRLRGKENRSEDEVVFPERALEHPEVAKLWAGQRIQSLLERIRLEGEKKEWVDEIIGLSKRFKIVTPYTSMLAAHRSYLLPGAIRPSDPLLIVKTHPDIRSVEARLPFGDSLKLRYDADLGHWRGRFLVPENARDGVYECTLVLQDVRNQLYVEKKRFRVDSTAPVFTLTGDGVGRRYAPGDVIPWEVRAPADTRRISAFNPVLGKAELTYDPRSHSSRGFLAIPSGVPPGLYRFTVEAVDFAQNQFSRTITIEVRP